MGTSKSKIDDEFSELLEDDEINDNTEYTDASKDVTKDESFEEQPQGDELLDDDVEISDNAEDDVDKQVNDNIEEEEEEVVDEVNEQEPEEAVVEESEEPEEPEEKINEELDADEPMEEPEEPVVDEPIEEPTEESKEESAEVDNVDEPIGNISEEKSEEKQADLPDSAFSSNPFGNQPKKQSFKVDNIFSKPASSTPKKTTASDFDDMFGDGPSSSTPKKTTASDFDDMFGDMASPKKPSTTTPKKTSGPADLFSVDITKPKSGAQKDIFAPSPNKNLGDIFGSGGSSSPKFTKSDEKSKTSLDDIFSF